MTGGSNNTMALWAAFLAGAACGVFARYVFDYARSSAQNAAAVTAVTAMVAIVFTVANSLFRS